MAETNTVMSKRKLGTIAIQDGGSIDYEIPVILSMNYTPGLYDMIDIRDTNGDYTGLSPTHGDEQPTAVTIEATQRGLGGRALAADMGLIDFINQSGAAASATSTGTEDGSVTNEHAKMFTVVVTETDHTGTTTTTFERSTFEGSGVAIAPDGNKLNLNITSRKAKPTVAFVAAT